MTVLLSILIVIVSVLLVLVIMVQNPKGGGLSSTFGGGGNQMMGVKKTTDFLDKSTWTLAIILVALALISNLSINSGEADTEAGSQIEEQVDDFTPVVPQQVVPQEAPPATETPAEGAGQ